MLFVMTQILVEMTATMFLLIDLEYANCIVTKYATYSIFFSRVWIHLFMYFSHCALFSGMKVLYGVHRYVTYKWAYWEWKDYFLHCYVIHTTAVISKYLLFAYSFLVWTFFAVSYKKTALVNLFLFYRCVLTFNVMRCF